MQYQVFTLIVTLSQVIYMKLFTANGKEFWYLLVCARIEKSLGFRKLLIVSLSGLSGSRWWRSALLGKTWRLKNRSDNTSLQQPGRQWVWRTLFVRQRPPDRLDVVWCDRREDPKSTADRNGSDGRWFSTGGSSANTGDLVIEMAMKDLCDDRRRRRATAAEQFVERPPEATRLCLVGVEARSPELGTFLV